MKEIEELYAKYLMIGIAASLIGILGTLVTIWTGILRVPTSVLPPTSTSSVVPTSTTSQLPQTTSVTSTQPKSGEAAGSDNTARDEQLMREQREAVRRQREAEEQARREEDARIWAPIIDSVRVGKPLTGRISQLLAADYSFLMRFTNLDESTGAIEGTVEFPSAHCIVKFSGNVSKAELLFTTTEFIRPAANCIIGASWRIQIRPDSNRWYGEIEDPQLQSAADRAFRIRVIVNIE